MKVLISGSSGFIGYHLASFLIKKGIKVLGVDNHNNYYSKHIKNKRLFFLKKKKNFKFHKVDITKIKNLEKIFFNFKPDIVFHLAGQPGVLYSLKNPKSYKLNNFIGTKNMCKMSKKHKVKKFFFASSSSVYGDQKRFPIKENFKLNPKNPYAITKLNSEKIVKKTFDKSKVKYLIFRFFTVFGPFGRPDMFIHKFLNNIKKRKVTKLYNNGMNFRDFTYVDDVVKILFQALNKNMTKETINICRSNPIITLELVSKIKKNFKAKKAIIKQTGFVKGEMLKTHGCNSKLISKFKGIKFTNFDIGLEKTIKTFKSFGF